MLLGHGHGLEEVVELREGEQRAQPVSTSGMAQMSHLLGREGHPPDKESPPARDGDRAGGFRQDQTSNTRKLLETVGKVCNKCNQPPLVLFSQMKPIPGNPKLTVRLLDY